MKNYTFVALYSSIGKSISCHATCNDDLLSEQMLIHSLNIWIFSLFTSLDTQVLQRRTENICSLVAVRNDQSVQWTWRVISFSDFNSKIDETIIIHTHPKNVFCDLWSFKRTLTGQ